LLFVVSVINRIENVYPTSLSTKNREEKNEEIYQASK